VRLASSTNRDWHAIRSARRFHGALDGKDSTPRLHARIGERTILQVTFMNRASRVYNGLLRFASCDSFIRISSTDSSNDEDLTPC
jgi:hypothetical protein